VFVKELGAKPIMRDSFGVEVELGTCPKLMLCDRKGGDINEWPEDLRVLEFPR
jgi:hypothetical protein